MIRFRKVVISNEFLEMSIFKGSEVRVIYKEKVSKRKKRTPNEHNTDRVYGVGYKT